MTQLLNKYFDLEMEYKEKPHKDFGELKEQKVEFAKISALDYFM
jgi:hypothetical protein